MKSSENRETSLPHSTLTDPRERIANMRKWNEANVGDYWKREADFWEGLLEQLEALRGMLVWAVNTFDPDGDHWQKEFLKRAASVGVSYPASGSKQHKYDDPKDPIGTTRA